MLIFQLSYGDETVLVYEQDAKKILYGKIVAKVNIMLSLGLGMMCYFHITMEVTSGNIT